jgi:hypothetical protein
MTDTAPTESTDASSQAAGAPRMCRLCRKRRVPPSCLTSGDYRCSRCRHRTPHAMARDRRYARGALRRAVVKRDNDKRIWVGDDYHSRTQTADLARLINAHIKDRRRCFSVSAPTTGA